MDDDSVQDLFRYLGRKCWPNPVGQGEDFRGASYLTRGLGGIHPAGHATGVRRRRESFPDI